MRPFCTRALGQEATFTSMGWLVDVQGGGAVPLLRRQPAGLEAHLDSLPRGCSKGIPHHERDFQWPGQIGSKAPNTRLAHICLIVQLCVQLSIVIKSADMVGLCDGQVHFVTVKGGPNGYADFIRDIQNIFGITTEHDMQLAFDCADPLTGEHLHHTVQWAIVLAALMARQTSNPPQTIESCGHMTEPLLSVVCGASMCALLKSASEQGLPCTIVKLFLLTNVRCVYVQDSC